MRYVIVENGKVTNVIIWDGVEDFGLGENEEAIEVPEDSPVGPGYTYVDGQFIAPPIPDEDVIKANTQYKTTMMNQATEMISLLGDATDPDIMGEDINPIDVTNLKLWKQYRVSLSRVTDMLNPVWPTKPE